MSGDNGVIVEVLPAERRVAEARARLLLARARTGDALAALRADIAERADWQTWYRNRPGLFLAAAFAIGLYLGRRR